MTWGRDSAFAIMTYSKLGRFNHVKKSLKFLAKHQKNGEIPNWLYYDESKVNYGSCDSTALWLVALADYLEKSDDMKFYSQMEDQIHEAINYYKNNSDRSGLFECKKEHTWMDTVNREGKPIELQAFWYLAFQKLGEVLGNDSYLSAAKKIKKSVIKNYKKKGWFTDRIGSNERTINTLFLLWAKMLNEKEAEPIFKALESPEFTTKHGIRSLSAWDEHYDNDSYHQGAVWGFLTNIAALAELNYGRKKQAKKYIEIQKKNMGLRCNNTWDEYYNSEAEGCLSQLWSACLLSLAILKYNEI